MNTPTTVRPGPLHGTRPEGQLQTSNSKFEAALGRWLSRLSRTRPTEKRFAPHLANIKQRAADLSDLPQDDLDARLLKVRSSVRHSGLNDEQMYNVFGQLVTRCQKTLGITPHDQQLYAAWCMAHGVMVEMNTGEGKTLTAALTATLVALSGAPVHVVTANDYLVERDARKLHPLYRQFGLRVGFVRSDMSENDRRTAYLADVVYCSNKQLIFDYLRDCQRLGNSRTGLSAELASLFTTHQTPTLLRGLCFAIVDEADSALIDDARTPMIISQSTPATREEITEATVALGIARSLDQAHYQVDQRKQAVSLTAQGMDRVRELTNKLKGKWQQARYVDERVRQALMVLHVFKRDQHYLVTDDQVALIDASSGRILEDRKLQNGLHRMLEIHAGCPPSEDTQALAALSFQRFFPRFAQLAGMSGTLWESRRELLRVYDRQVVRVQPHKPSRRNTEPLMVSANREEHLELAITEIKNRLQRGQPVLIGTRTVEFSERVSAELVENGIEHQLLNARQDAEEANIVAAAGQQRTVTVATNMAGRGTDIPLSKDALEAGGLHVLCLELNDSVRVDRQLFGRGARQGDPGSAQAMVCLEDELIVNFVGSSLVDCVKRLMRTHGYLGQFLARRIVRLAQKRCEQHQERLRKTAFEAAQHLNRRLAFSGEPE